MKFTKFFIITLSIISFLSTSVLSKSFSLCAESHSEKVNIDKKSEIENHLVTVALKRKRTKIYALSVTVI